MIRKYTLNYIIPGLFILVTVLTTLLSLTGYLGRFHFILDLTSHFKLQYLILGFCPFFFFLFTRRKAWWIVSLFCIFINLIEVFPWYLPQSAIATRSAQQLRVLQSNVLYDNTQYSQVISLVRKEKPDIAVFVEVSNRWAKELEALRDILPYSALQQDSDSFGTEIYSKLPLRNTSVQSLKGGRKVLVSSVNIRDRVVTIIGVHLNIPTRKGLYYLRNQQLATLADYVAKIKNPVLVVGDFNITMWSPFYKRFVRKANLQNARSGFGLLPSWPSKMPLLSIPIDHCLISPNIKVLKIRTGRKVGSDHLPLITDLAVGDR